ncbi:Ig-like domain-containing protein [Clostridium saccharoperbutylacetonicum]|jgi:uncharacterized protein YjdB
MKNYFKKFSIMFAILLTVVGFGMIYNVSAANAATIGDVLTTPENGWRRIDDTDKNILRDSNVGYGTLSNFYNGSQTSMDYYNSGVKFKFYGTKLRIIAVMAKSDISSTIRLTIDGKIYSYSQISSGLKFQSIVDEVDDLQLGFHTVSLTNLDYVQHAMLDAIDIDDVGYLVNPNESISLSNTSLNLIKGDTKSLTATTTPAGEQVSWTSSDDSIATVDSTGTVSGTKVGSCIITAATEDGLTAACAVTVTEKDVPNTDNPTQPTGDENLYIQLINGDVKKYTVTTDGFNKFKQWYIDRVDNKAGSPIYKFDKDSSEDYVICDKIEWFEIRK